jgi:myo-inositol-1(or 4)-monophosphatase
MINKEYKNIIKAAVIGGKIVKKHFGGVLNVTVKSNPSDLRTIADLESEAAIIKILSKKFPKYNIIGEESGEISKGSQYTFIIDPLDGTNNFVLGIPYFSTVIALMKGEETIFGVIYNPMLKKIYFAEKGQGAYLNNERISVNNESSIENSSVSIVVEYGDKGKLQENLAINLYKMNAKRVLTNWSVLLDFCLLASGKIEAILVATQIPLHDFVAGKLLAKEAGAVVTDLSGAEETRDVNNTFIISNGTKIHGEILNLK